MEGPDSYTGRRCGWCGTQNSAGANVCSKCGAVFSSTEQREVNASNAALEARILAPVEVNPTDDQGVSALVDSSLFDRMSGDAMRSFGLGPAFVSGQTLAFVVAGCLSLYILVSLIAAVVDISQVIRLSSAPADLRNLSAEMTASVLLALLMRLALIAVGLLTAVAFLFWIYRAHKNLKALGATDLKYSPGWAVGGFFVPLLNFVRPYQVVVEIWKFSASVARRAGGVNWTYEQTPLFISLWWGAWLISGLLDSLGVFIVFGARTTTQLLVAGRYRLAYDVISIASAALAMTVVLSINARQERANRSTSSYGGATEPAIESGQL